MDTLTINSRAKHLGAAQGSNENRTNRTQKYGERESQVADTAMRQESPVQQTMPAGRTTLLSVGKEIEINAYTFTNKQDFKSVPKTITVDEQRYSFVDSGLRYLVRQGQDLIRLFDMTDGQSTYRLKNQADHWTLVTIKPLT